MKLRNIASSLAVLGAAATFSPAALAEYVVLDGWRLDTPTTSTSNIGRLNLVSGTANIQQETDALGNVFVGADFSESGAIYNISYTPENVVGAGDTWPGPGLPPSVGSGLTISFSGVAGKISSISASGFSYVFTGGSFTIASADGGTSGGSIVGLGGNGAATNIIGGTTGDSTLLATILASSGLSYYDNAGNLLNPLMAAGLYLFEATTNNNITNLTGSTVTSCDLVEGTYCLNLSAASGGDAYIVKVIPEPATMALLGLGLLGMGFSSRRKGKTA